MNRTPVVPLDDLAQRIAQQQAELETLRSEYQARQAQLADLAGRKQHLEEQLRQVEVEIQAISQGAAPAQLLALTEQPALSAEEAKEPPAANRSPLPELILEVLRTAAGPVTVRMLTEEAGRRGYARSSSNLTNLVRFHVHQLKKKGRLVSAAGQPGYVLAHSANGKQAPRGSSRPTAPRESEPPQPTTAARKKGQGKATPPPRLAPPSKPGHQTKGTRSSARAQGPKKQPPLRVVLTELLQRARQPLTGRELAEQVEATGHHTTSKSLKDVVWAMLGQMDNVEHLPGKGYRLRKKA